ncbi:MAG TPA: CBS domain-containing protein, partial [Chloroflexi bacterium]|nr:CBS domain-containing protein [Chloroflexota bacterium]
MVTSTVGQVLKEKGNQVWTTSPDTIVYQALKLMSDKNIGALV